MRVSPCIYTEALTVLPSADTQFSFFSAMQMFMLMLAVDLYNA